MATLTFRDRHGGIYTIEDDGSPASQVVHQRLSSGDVQRVIDLGRLQQNETHHSQSSPPKPSEQTRIQPERTNLRAWLRGE
jgi:hypothetical protein